MLRKKVLITAVIFLVNCSIYAQLTLNGKYSNLAPGQEHYKFYEFNKNGTFEFHAGASLGDDLYGNGIYQVVGNTIKLKYTTSPKTRSYHMSKTFINDKDSVIIRFQVFKLNKEKISGVNAVWDEGQKDYQGVILDEITNGEIALRKNNDSLKIVLSSLGYESYELYLDRRYNYKIKAYLQEQGVGSPIKNQTEKLTIMKDENNNIVLKDAKDQRWTMYK